jgi:hypothetical protein
VRNDPENLRSWPGDSMDWEKFGVKFIFGLSTRPPGLQLPSICWWTMALKEKMWKLGAIKKNFLGRKASTQHWNQGHA